MNMALTCARINSKGVPRKNLRLLGNQELIGYTLEAARHAPSITHVFVATESFEIADVSASFGVRVVHEPSCLAVDGVETDEAYLFTVRQLREAYGYPEDSDTLVFLQANSPFRTEEHIEGAIKLHEDMGYSNTVISCYGTTGYYWVYDPKHPFHITPIGHNPIHRLGRQWNTKEPMLKENGAIYVLTTERFLQSKVQRARPWVPYMMSEEDSLDIDTEEQFELAEAIMEKRNDNR